jgi:hypothetical protein
MSEKSQQRLKPTHTPSLAGTKFNQHNRNVLHFLVFGMMENTNQQKNKKRKKCYILDRPLPINSIPQKSLQMVNSLFIPSFLSLSLQGCGEDFSLGS